MNLLNKILDNPAIWNISQFIFGNDKYKKDLYRLAIPSPGKILDFGCADGNTFLAFKDFEYYGVDINKNLIDYAKKKYSKFKNANFLNANILDRPFGENFFDCCLFACTGHHLPDEMLFKIMPVLADCLKPGGSLYIFDTIKRPDRDSRLLKFLINLDQGQFMRTEEKYNLIIDKLSPKLKLLVKKTMQVRGNFFPQPTYYFAEFKKV